MQKGKYIVIEGQDGAGKTTQIDLLARYLEGQGKKVLVVKEPGSLPVGEKIRELVKDKTYGFSAEGNLLLFTAARLELWRKVIAPALEQGVYVLCDRNWWSTLAYQHYGQGLDRELITGLTQQLLDQKYITPDLGFVIVLAEQTRLERMQARNHDSSQDAFESRLDSFQTKVAQAYPKIARLVKAKIIDGNPSAPEVHQQIVEALGEL